MTLSRRLSVTTLAMLCLAPAARADTFYVVVFGAQSKPQRPKFSHSWATFVRIPGQDCGGPPAPDAGPPEIFTISWYAASLELHPNRLLPEPGCNLKLHRTFQTVLSHCENIGAWGPFQITPELYCLAAKHAQRLNNGELQYKTIDYAHLPNRVSNCIHALTVFVPDRRRVRIGRTNFGEVASYYVAENYRNLLICPCEVHCWIADLLGLGQYPIKWRRLEDGRPRPSREY
jgi:hypothetical protein